MSISQEVVATYGTIVLDHNVPAVIQNKKGGGGVGVGMAVPIPLG